MASGSDDPALTVQRHGDDAFVLRQGKSVHFEAPFLFLLLGRERALLLDTGAEAPPEAFPLRAAVDRLIGSLPLVVAHTHAHADHVAGDAQLLDRPDTVVVGHDAATVSSFFGLDDPGSSASFDLGGRVLEIVATPGHDRAAITILDPATGWLLTGDTVYPGRLYIEDDAAFAASLDRLVELAQDRAVTAVVGCHIEMSTEPGVDYPEGTIEQPSEAPLFMPPSRLEAVRAAARAAIGVPGRHVHDDFVLVNRTR